MGDTVDDVTSGATVVRRELNRGERRAWLLCGVVSFVIFIVLLLLCVSEDSMVLDEISSGVVDSSTVTTVEVSSTALFIAIVVDIIFPCLVVLITSKGRSEIEFSEIDSKVTEFSVV